MFRARKSTSAMYDKEIMIIIESIKSNALRTMRCGHKSARKKMQNDRV
jgi:hypothetical protein